MIRYTQPYEAPQPMSNAPMLMYYEEPNESYITELEQPMYAEEPYQSWEMNEGMAQSSYVSQPSRDQYLVDERTLMFIANQNYKPRGYPNRERQPMGPPPPDQQPIGPCFNCGSPDHWERSCPHKGQRVKIYGFCSDCGIKHILPECPRNPDNKGKATLNKVGVLPSASSGSETEPMVQVNVVTRAQAKELEKENPMEKNARVPVLTKNGSLSVRTQCKSWKAKRERMKARRAESQTAIQKELQEVKQQLQQELESKKVEQNNQPRKAPSGGSVLVDKVLEPLDALLQQWEASDVDNFIVLHKVGLVPNEEAMAKLETLIQIGKEALKDMGLDIEVHNLDNLAEEAAQLHTIVIGVYMLRCQHPYHPLCFVTACKSADQCLFHGCEDPLKYALKLMARGEANMDEHVGTEKDPMEGIFGSLVDGIAHSQVGSSHKPNIDIMYGGCGDKNASQKQAGEDTPGQQKAKKRAEKKTDIVEAQGDASKELAEVSLKPEPTINKDVEDAKKSSEKPNEKDTTVNLSDEDADLLISNVCGEILGHRLKRSNIEERATPKKKAKAWYLSMVELRWIGDVQEPDETVEDIIPKQAIEQDVDVTPDRVEENQE
ncbi:hypothetical protein L7F22_062368 [Adiantum nelumboides]|nr:hypothetical protein [Adiantum nelumboides]